jgi:16S rRNA (adenine1518-N6/adenine1519-N6)-dimethyltransferase
MRPKKYLGQHFLVDQNIARKIAGALKASSSRVLEVGPGKGILTGLLLADSRLDVMAVDIDHEAIDYLQTLFPDHREKFVEGDFLKLDVAKLFSGPFSVIGNFPYNISSQILFKVLTHRDQMTEVVGMFQKEVAERIVAVPGSKVYGILSVLVQTFYHADYLFTVGEQVFYPRPKVKSAVIRLIRNERGKLACKEDFFFEVVKTAFNQRRKTLRNALKSFDTEKKLLHESIFSSRAEQLSVEEFILMATELEKVVQGQG